jgi:hypothetical protein
MAGLNLVLGDLEFDTTNGSPLGIALPVTRGLLRFFLPGQKAGGDIDLSGSGVLGAPSSTLPAFTIRQDWHIDLVTNVSTGAWTGNYLYGLPVGSQPRPPVSLIYVGYNGVDFGDSGSASSAAGMVLDNGVLKCQGPAGYASAGTPTITPNVGYKTEFNFFAVTYDWVSGGNQTEKLYYGRGGALVTASGTQTAGVQTADPTLALQTASRGNTTGSTNNHGLAAAIVHNVKLTDLEIANTYAWLTRYFSGRLPNNNL